MSKSEKPSLTTTPQPETSPAPDATSKLIVMSAGTNTGGVAKSTNMVELVEWYDAQGIETTKLDLDETSKSKGSLSAYFPDAIKGRLFDQNGMNAILDALDRPAPVIMVDTAASTSHSTAEWFDSTYPELKALGHRILALGAVTPDTASVEGLLRWAGLVQHRATYIPVKSPIPPKTPFQAWEISKEEREAGSVRVLHPAVVEFQTKFGVPPESALTMPYRDPDFQQILRRESVTVARAASGQHQVTALATSRYRILAQGYHRQITAQFNRVRAQLLSHATASIQ